MLRRVIITVVFMALSMTTFSQTFKWRDWKEKRAISDCEFKLGEDTIGKVDFFIGNTNKGGDVSILSELSEKELKEVRVVHEKPEVYQEFLYAEQLMPTVIGVSNTWKILDDPYYTVYCKTPFNTGIDKTKNFDIFFFLSDEYNPKIVTKNYFTYNQSNNILSMVLFIGRSAFDIQYLYENVRHFSGQKMAIYASNTALTPYAYRTVNCHSLNFLADILDRNDYSKMSPEERGRYQSDSSVCAQLDELMNNCTQGKVYILYETRDGEIKRTLNTAQVQGLKELIKIFKYYKYGERYVDNFVKSKCENIKTLIDGKHQAHSNKVQAYNDSIEFYRDIMRKRIIAKEASDKAIKDSLYNEKRKELREIRNKELVAAYKKLLSLYEVHWNAVEVKKIETRKIPKTKKPVLYEPVPEMLAFQDSIERYVKENPDKIIQLKIRIDDLGKYFTGEALRMVTDTITHKMIELFIYEKSNLMNKYAQFKDPDATVRAKLGGVQPKNTIDRYSIVIRNTPTYKELHQISDLLNKYDINIMRVSKAFSKEIDNFINACRVANEKSKEDIEKYKKMLNEMKL